tara:strand:- start:1954 stop:2619 length:666 start_codon:yes stop_codon:yes gene_type:complete
MKKDDLRHDPVRENMLNILSYLRKNLSVSVAIAIGVVSCLVFFLSSLEDSNEPDYSFCYNIDQDSDLRSICENDEVKNAIADINNDKSSNQYILSFLSDFSSKSSAEKLKSLNEFDFSNIESKFLEFELLKFYGDLLVDNKDFDLGIDKYKQALTLIDGKNESFALVNYKIAIALMSDNKFTESNKFLNYAKDCEHQNTSLSKDVDILKSKLAHILSTSDK